jgi:hypothetical protein
MKHLILASLAKSVPHWSAADREEAYAGLDRDGLVGSNGGHVMHAVAGKDPVIAALAAQADTQKTIERGIVMSPRMCASAHQNNKVLLRQAVAACARVGYRLDPDSNERVDIQKLNAAIKESNASIDERFRLREILGVLHLTER